MIDRSNQQFGNYRIIRSIGHGGFADVYLGEHIYLQTQVAIKLLQTRLAAEAMEEFLKEARTIAHLINPHIVRVLDFGTEGGIPFLVMDYAHNGTLRQHHPKGTRLSLDTVVDYTKQIAEALQYAHEKKVIHRDIKPENMLLGENHQVLLSDFGIALVARSTRYENTQEVIGTAAYMAPEQLQGKPRRASDQYALGIVVYEWLCGDRPFHGSFTEIYSQHLFVPPPSLREKRPELPPAIEEVVLTTLAKDPNERFATIQAFATALEQTCQRVSPALTALSPELPSSSKPLPPIDTMAAFPAQQVSELPNTRTSASPPAKAPSATPLAAPFSATNLPHDENATPISKTSRNSAPANRLQDFRISRTVLLIGLVLLVLVASPELFNIMKTNQQATSNANATATVRRNRINAANAAATGTATAQHMNYVQATSGTPALDDPLIDNSKGNGWAEDSFCKFSSGKYHVTSPKWEYGGFLVSYTRPGLTFSNFAFQVQMTILKGDYGGIVFRTNQAQPFGYRFAFRSDQAQSGGGDLAYEGQPLLAKFTGITAHLDQTYLLTAIARGSSISLYINKQLVMSVENSSAGSGGIGLMVGNAADVVFGNAQVWNL